MVQSEPTPKCTIIGKENEVHNLSFAANVLLREHTPKHKARNTKGQVLQQKDTPRVVAILQTKENSKFKHPFMPVVVETLDIKEAALVNLGACLNFISHELMQKLGQMSVDPL